MTRAERRKNPDYRIAELEAELERLREELGVERQLRKDWGISAFEAQKEVGRLREELTEAHNDYVDAQDELRRLRELETTTYQIEPGIARLHRIEEAARDVLRQCWMPWKREAVEALRAALGEEA